ncbi:amino acid ABC transporter [Aureimonas flava]|uniref:Amino acid ABC transporter n=1 Tax=Aureimonas flava TaxID=2320271 RepID=A0A3A1WM05_9HYPH|nr:transporter substrate-binding domain-containing protein [Aureimonas flava]RIY01396.1 amino acid ABC transporter [Aureimonas flava]
MAFKRLLVACALAMATLGSVAAHAQTLDRIKSTGTLRIALDPNVPPWSYKDENLHYAGYEWMVADKFAKDHDLKLEVTETNGANRIPLLVTGRVDLVFAAMTITDERKKTIDFSLPYGGTEIAISGPVGDGVTSAEGLNGKRVGVARGALQDTLVTAADIPGLEIVRFEDESTAITAVLSGQLNYIAQATSVNTTIMKRNPSIKIEPKVVLGGGMHGIGMRKGEADLKSWVDEWVRQNMENGELQKMYVEVHGVPMPEQVVAAATGK